QEHEGGGGGERGAGCDGAQRSGHGAIEILLLVAGPEDRIFPEGDDLDRAVGIPGLDQELPLVDVNFRLCVRCWLGGGGPEENPDDQEGGEQALKQSHHGWHAMSVACANMPPKSSPSPGFQSTPLVDSMSRVCSSSPVVGT